MRRAVIAERGEGKLGRLLGVEGMVKAMMEVIAETKW